VSIGWADFLIAARLELFTTALDAASPTAGKLRIYNATRPAKGAAITTQTKLVEFAFPIPSKSSTTGNVEGLALPPSSIGLATDVAVWCRFVDGAGTFLADGDVGAIGSGAVVELSSTSIITGGAVSIVTGTQTES